MSSRPTPMAKRKRRSKQTARRDPAPPREATLQRDASPGAGLRAAMPFLDPVTVTAGQAQAAAGAGGTRGGDRK